MVFEWANRFILLEIDVTAHIIGNNSDRISAIWTISVPTL